MAGLPFQKRTREYKIESTLKVGNLTNIFMKPLATIHIFKVELFIMVSSSHN